jgi:hypothetical protein
MSESLVMSENGEIGSNKVSLTVAFLLGKIVLASHIAKRCSDAERAERMQRAVAKFCEQVHVSTPDEALRSLQRWSQ